MRKTSFAIVLPVAASMVVFAAPPSFGGFGGTISSGTVTFVRTDSSFDSTPEADLTGISVPATQDHLFQIGWAFRVAGDDHETFFGAPDSATYVDDHSDIHWNDVGGRGLFSATEHSAVFSITNGGLLNQQMTIVNLSPANALDVHVFHVVDIDLQPSASDDLGVLQEWTPSRIIGIEDSGSNFADYHSAPFSGDPAAAGFLVRANGTGDVVALLGDAGITTFDDSGLPFGPDDLTAGYDFPFIVPSSGNAHAEVFVFVNYSVNCDSPLGVFCDGFEIGNRSVWSSSVP